MAKNTTTKSVSKKTHGQDAGGSPSDGQKKAQLRRIEEQNTRDRIAAERRQRELTRQREAEAQWLTQVSNALKAFDGASKRYDMLCASQPGHYGLKLSKQLEHVSLFGEIVVRVEAVAQGYTAIKVVASSFPPIEVSDDFFLPVFCLKSKFLKNIGQGMACFEWQQELHAALRANLADFIAKMDTLHLENPIKVSKTGVTAPQFGNRQNKPEPKKEPQVVATHRIDGIDLDASIPLTKELMELKVEDGYPVLCHVQGEEHDSFFLRERVAGVQVITLLAGGDDLTFAISEEYPAGISVEVKSIIDGPTENLISVDVKSVRNARQHLVAWIRNHVDLNDPVVETAEDVPLHIVAQEGAPNVQEVHAPTKADHARVLREAGYSAAEVLAALQGLSHNSEPMKKSA